MAVDTMGHEGAGWYLHRRSATRSTDVDTHGSGHYTANCLLFPLIAHTF